MGALLVMGVREHYCGVPVPFAAHAKVRSWKYTRAAGSAWQRGHGNTVSWDPITHLSPLCSWRQNKPEGDAESQPGGCSIAKSRVKAGVGPYTDLGGSSRRPLVFRSHSFICLYLLGACYVSQGQWQGFYGLASCSKEGRI